LLHRTCCCTAPALYLQNRTLHSVSGWPLPLLPFRATLARCRAAALCLSSLLPSPAASATPAAWAGHLGGRAGAGGGAPCGINTLHKRKKTLLQRKEGQRGRRLTLCLFPLHCTSALCRIKKLSAQNFCCCLAACCCRALLRRRRRARIAAHCALRLSRLFSAASPTLLPGRAAWRQGCRIFLRAPASTAHQKDARIENTSAACLGPLSRTRIWDTCASRHSARTICAAAGQTSALLASKRRLRAPKSILPPSILSYRRRCFSGASDYLPALLLSVSHCTALPPLRSRGGTGTTTYLFAWAGAAAAWR